MKICVVIPVMNERPTLDRLVQDIIEHIAPHRYRIIFVDDGSTDGSWDEMMRLCHDYPHVEAICFARNLGKTAALDVAFREVDGDLVLTMDADLQDDPAEIPRLIEKLGEGHDMVCGWKSTRHDPWHKTIPSHLFNATLGWFFGFRLNDINTGFKLMRTRVAKGLVLFADMHRMVAVQAHEQGWDVAEIPVTHHPRRFGQSKFGLERIYRGFRDAYVVWLMYRCKGGPARHFGARAAVCFAAALGTLAVEYGAGRSAAPEALLTPAASWGIAALTALACAFIAAGTALLTLGASGQLLLRKVSARPVEYPVLDRIGGE